MSNTEYKPTPIDMEVNCSRPCEEGESDIMYQKKPNGCWYRLIIGYRRAQHNWVLPVIVAQSAGYPSWARLCADFPQFNRKNPAEYSKPGVDFDKGLQVGGNELQHCITLDKVRDMIEEAFKERITGKDDPDPENGIVLDRGVLYITIRGKRHRVAMADELEKITK